MIDGLVTSLRWEFPLAFALGTIANCPGCNPAPGSTRPTALPSILQACGRICQSPTQATQFLENPPARINGQHHLLEPTLRIPFPDRVRVRHRRVSQSGVAGVGPSSPRLHPPLPPEHRRRSRSSGQRRRRPPLLNNPQGLRSSPCAIPSPDRQSCGRHLLPQRVGARARSTRSASRLPGPAPPSFLDTCGWDCGRSQTSTEVERSLGPPPFSVQDSSLREGTAVTSAIEIRAVEDSRLSAQRGASHG